MLFHSLPFILGFLPLCLGGFFFIGRIAPCIWPVRWLIGASLVFYGWWDPRFVPLLIGSILVNHAIGRQIRAAAIRSSNHARLWLIVGIALNLGVLFWFKYADFVLHAVTPAAAPLNLALPLAVSFFTFQQIMFLAEARTDPTQPRDLTHTAAFVTFFPHLIAGPIVRPNDIIPQFTARGLSQPNTENLTTGLVIFLLGLGKKLALADMFGGFADTGFNAAAAGHTLTLFEAWFATLAYSLQIYFDFSGYSDMAMGLARMMNIRFPLNFDSPYQATDIAGFWRRWHITLGLFLRDFVYIPLGGSRQSPVRRLINLFATMLLCGLWHGAAWQFVVWGALHGGFLVIHALWTPLGLRLPSLLARALTLIAVIAAWVPFRADNLDTAWSMLRAMAGANGAALPAMIAGAFPPLAALATPVAALPYLGDGRTLSFPEVAACLLLGWFIVLALPNMHAMSGRTRAWALTSGFAFTLQALCFAPRIAPFLYFRF